MPTFPAFKTKPYYDALKAWLTTSLNEDGTLRSDAVQAEVSAAIAAEPTVVQAAADAAAAAVPDALAATDFGPYVGPEVDAHIAADPAFSAAAETAVTDEIAGRDIVETKPMLDPNIAWAWGTGDQKMFWPIIMKDETLHPYTLAMFAKYFAQLARFDRSATGYSFALIGADNKVSDLALGPDGHFADHVVANLASRMGEQIVPDDLSPQFPTLDWAHWGDSLTGNSYPATMATLTGRNHYNGGLGGQTTPQIAARMGAVPAMVTLDGNVIPASGPVAVTSIFPNPVNAPTVATRTMTVTIGGVRGTLAEGGTTTSAVFTRETNGEAVPVSPGTLALVPDADAYRDRTTVIWSGRNSSNTMSGHQIASYIQQMIDYLTPRVKRVMVLQIFPSKNEPNGSSARDRLDAANDALEKAFSQYYVPIGDWLMTAEAATYAGITWSVDDETDIANGLVPRQLMADDTHLTTAGNTAVANHLYDMAKVRGWIL